MDPDVPGALDLDDLVAAGEQNPLLRRVDALCEARAWDDLVTVAQRCREAYERGQQLWPIAEHIDYRLALEAPGRYAAGVLTPSAGRFALGPLTEVAASTHTFDELLAHLPSPQVAGVIAAERVLRGEDLTGRDDAHPEVLELPMYLAPWEPDYPLATYWADKVEAPAPEFAPLSERGHPGRGIPAEVLDEPELLRALLDLVATWVTSSSGQAEATIVEGPAPAAIAAMGHDEFLIGELTAPAALGLMAWAGASGGAHGRRRGAAAGRSAGWWAAAALCDLDWPVAPDHLITEMQRLRWYRWEPVALPGGWSLHLAVHDAEAGWAVALEAQDRAS